MVMEDITGKILLNTMTRLMSMGTTINLRRADQRILSSRFPQKKTLPTSYPRRESGVRDSTNGSQSGGQSTEMTPYKMIK